MAEATLAGRPAALDDAVAAAARLLGASHCPVIAGLATDIAGAQAAVALARACGGVLDHMRSAAVLRDLDAMREAGWIVTSPQQARARADLVLLVGPGLAQTWPDLAGWLRLDRPPALGVQQPRRVLRLCPGREPSPVPDAETISGTPGELPEMLAALRALVAGRRVAATGRWARLLPGLVEALRAAHYGVVLWSAAQLDALTIEMLCGLMDDLNATTRFAGLPLPAEGNAMGVAHALAWRTGYPLRVGFARGEPEHDPWRFDAARMVESGEADAALWIAAARPEPPPWRRQVPLVALLAEGMRLPNPPEVAITVGRPGLDHDSVLFDPVLNVLAAKPAAAPAPAPRVDAVLTRIAALLREPAPC